MEWIGLHNEIDGSACVGSVVDIIMIGLDDIGLDHIGLDED